MTLMETLEARKPPLREAEGGVLRVGKTRVSLETVIGAFHEGAGAEEIVLRYSSLELADVYAVIAYYLQHQAEVDAYVAERRKDAERVRGEMQERFPTAGVRERLLARQAEKRGA